MTHKQKVLGLLRDGRWHTHHELYRLGCVAHSRISDLRKDGWQIEQERQGDDYCYRLLGRLEQPDGVNVPSGSSSGSGPLPQPELDPLVVALLPEPLF